MSPGGVTVLQRSVRPVLMCSAVFVTGIASPHAADSPGAAPDPRAPAVESAEFCCVLRSRLGSHSLVYGAEVDGVDPHRLGESLAPS